MPQRLVALFLLLLVAGCESPYRPMRQLNVSPNFSEEQTEIILQAVDAWCEAGVECLEVKISKSKRGGAIFPSKKCEGASPAFTDMHAMHAPRIHVCRYHGNEQLAWMVRHELGHAISRSDHHLKDGNTMQAVQPEDADRAAETDPGLTELDVKYGLGER